MHTYIPINTYIHIYSSYSSYIDTDHIHTYVHNNLYAYCTHKHKHTYTPHLHTYTCVCIPTQTKWTLSSQGAKQQLRKFKPPRTERIESTLICKLYKQDRSQVLARFSSIFGDETCMWEILGFSWDTHTYMHTYKHAYMYIYIHIYGFWWDTHTYMHTSIHTYVYTHMHTYIHTYIIHLPINHSDYQHDYLVNHICVWPGGIDMYKILSRELWHGLCHNAILHGRKYFSWHSIIWMLTSHAWNLWTQKNQAYGHAIQIYLHVLFC